MYCSDEYLLKLNLQYLNHDYYTDIITFDYVKDTQINGDLYISVDRVMENAGKMQLTVLEEIRRVMIHGLLHLCGYGDKSAAEERAMRKLENFYLNY